MANAILQDEDIKVAYFPDPPPYFRNFTTANLDRLAEIKKEAGIDDSASDTFSPTQLPAEQLLALPPELRCLIPPAPPADDEEFKVFGDVSRISGSDHFHKVMQDVALEIGYGDVLPNWSYEALYPTADEDATSAAATLDRQQYLFRFLRSIMIAYIELLGIMASDASSEAKDAKLRGILTLVTNMHKLINEYRPHQARETLILEMERQVERKKNEIEGVKKMTEKVRTTLEGFEKAAQGLEDRAAEETGFGKVESEDEKRRARQRSAWEALDDALNEV